MTDQMCKNNFLYGSDVSDSFNNYARTLIRYLEVKNRSDELQKEYGFELTTAINAPYDAVIVAVNHKDYLSLDEKYFDSILSVNGVLVDIKGIYKDTNFELDYWTL